MSINTKLQSLVDVIKDLGLSNNTAGITFILGQHQEKHVSYEELYKSSLGILHYLQEQGIQVGDEAVFQIDDHEEFIKIYWACLLGGIIPVPVTVGSAEEHILKFFKIWGVLHHPWLLTNEQVAASLHDFSEHNDLMVQMEVIHAKTLLVHEVIENSNAGSGTVYNAKPDDIAFVQFSSGSTGDPKGVTLTHRNLLANMDAIISNSQINDQDSVLSWMPLTHDMGLIGGHLVPLRMNIPQYSMSVTLFSRTPLLWMEKVSQYRATLLSSPNFGYQYLMKLMDRKSARNQDFNWDLSCVRLIFNGAEPISSEVCKQFLDVMQHYGLKRNVMYPVYGMAEASLAVTFPPPQEEMITLYLDRSSVVTGERVTLLTDTESDQAVSFVDLGVAVENCEFRICDKNNNLVEDLVIGYIHIKGDNVTGGYYNNQAATDESFTPDGWLITGDLGFTRNGRLMVTGRAKDIIFVNGQNIYAHDIERVVSSMPGTVVPNSGAFSVFNETSQQEDIMLAVVYRKSVKEFIPVERELKKYINKVMGLDIKHVIPIKRIPKTTSGKIQRYKFAQSYIAGEYDALLHEITKILHEEEMNRELTVPSTDTEAAILAFFQEVLGIERIDIHDNFFEIGGNSLRAAALVTKVQKAFGAMLPISEVFKAPTVKELAAWVETAEKVVYPTISKVEEQEYYELSSAQMRLYLLNQIEGTGISYNLPQLFNMEGKIDVERLERAFNELVQRQESLRTTFELIDGVPMQRIHPQMELKISHIEPSETDIVLIMKDFIQPFKLEHGPLLRIGIMKCAEEKHMLLLDMHHIISDGTSIVLLLTELMNLYNEVKLPELSIQYKDFSSWQNKLLHGEEMQQANNYWLGQFHSDIPKLDLQTDYARPSVQSFEGDSILFSLDKQLTEKIKKMAAQEGATLFMTLLAAYNVLLSRYTGQDDIVVGSPIAGRRHADLDSIVGMFVNTLALRNQPDREKTFRTFLQEVKQNSIHAYEHQDYPFEKLVEELDLPHDVSRNPLFDVVFVLQNFETVSPQSDQLSVIPHTLKTDTSKFDLTMYASDKNNTLEFELEYSTRLFTATRMTAVMNHFIRVLHEVVENVEIKLGEIEILTIEEQQALSSGLNVTAVSYDLDKSIHTLFEEQAARTPDHLAVVFEGTGLTYRECQQKSSQLAIELQARGIGTNDIVGIMVKPSVDMIVGILGILKAGAAFLPIDPAYPSERIAFMLEDSRASLLLSQTAIYEKAQYKGEVILDIMELTYETSIINAVVQEKKADLAYVIYTSGTTGLPKGVMVEHRSLVNFAQWQRDAFNITEHDKTTKYAGFAFDATILETFPYLIAGAAIYIVPDEIRLDAEALNEFFMKNGISIAFLPTQICEQFMQLENDSLRILLTGGDKLKTYIPRSYELMNCYGPTENTVVTSYFPVKEWSQNISIGKPIANTQVYIVDEHDRLQPVGIAGEICISGDSLAKGYLHRPELTTEKFAANPFVPGTRMYRTGDLARWQADGTIEYLGRIDQQVKIRGHRIELGEIEHVLLTYGPVKDVVVRAHEDYEHQKLLIAYVIAQNLRTEELRIHARKVLPDYMIPARFVVLDQFPLTPNGKIDWKSLQNVELAAGDVAEWIAPVSEVERKLAEIWQEVLSVKQVGLYDNFFDLGGHSLKVAALSSKLHKKFGVTIPLTELFKAQTLQEQSALVEAGELNPFTDIKKVAEAEYYNASSAQRRLFVLSQLEGAGINYNMPQVLDIEGHLSLERLTAAFQQLVQRHESLRTSFEIEHGEVVQRIHQHVELEISQLEVLAGDSEQVISRYIRPFDLNQAPLMRVALLKEADQKTKLLFDMHHIISDGISISIMIKEFISLYKGETLPEIAVQYKDFSAWHHTFLQSEELREQEAYWLQQFAGEIPILNLATDYPRPSVYSFEGDSIKFRLDREWTNRLRSFVAEHGATLYMALLAAFHAMLHKYSGQEDIIVGSPVAGRDHADFDNVIGMFVNTLAMRSRPEAGKTLRQFLTEVKHTALDAFTNQQFPFAELVEKVDLQRDMRRHPLFDVMFLMQNMDKTAIETEEFTFTPANFSSRVSKFDFTMFAEEQEDYLQFELEYCTKLFNRNSMEHMANHFIQIVKCFITTPDHTLSDISMLTDEEEHKIIYEFNDTKTSYPKDKTLADLFEEQVQKYPDHQAVIYGDHHVTYLELNERANSLAWILKANGVMPETTVAIMAERSIETIIAILAIVKSGGAYVPIDPEYPAERVELLLEDSGASLLLTTRELANKYKVKQAIIDIGDDSLFNGNHTNPEVVNRSIDLAYIIYTSGSTGRPKGVMVEHKNITRLVKNTNYAAFTHDDRFLQLGALVFDASTYEIWGALLNGASLYLVDKAEIVDPILFSDVLKRYDITSMFITAALFNQMVIHDGGAMFAGVRNLLVGGEALSPAHMNLVREHRQGLEATNAYGPTENTTFSVCCNIDREYEGNVPIGKPISNSTAYIVDQSGNLQPIGVPGELWVGGDGLARGYLNRPDLTTEKFVSNPFATGERVYKTGDLARWLPDGSIEYLGRIDQQVKIRGFRIEIGEVEAAILGMDDIREAAVVVKDEESMGKSLFAYIVSGENLAQSNLRERLTKVLPSYMIPSQFIQIEKIPLTTNGKLNTVKLLTLEGQAIHDHAYVAPSSPTEEKLAAIWSDILGIQQIGVSENFFEIGGHSLNATLLVSRIHKDCNVSIALKEVFTSPTIKEMAVIIDSTAVKNSYQAIQPTARSEHYGEGIYPTSAAQRRMYLMFRMDERSVTYNIPVALVIEGSIDLPHMKKVFGQLINRHESLRTSFKMIGSEVVQQIHQDTAFTIPYIENNRPYQNENEQIKEAIQQFVAPFHLEQDPLFRVELVKLSDDKHVMLFDIHHIVADGVSMDILTNDFIRLYAGQQLAPLEIQYKDFSAWQNKQVETGAIQQQEIYWKDLFSGEVPVLNMPTSYPRQVQRSFKGETLHFTLSGSLVEKLYTLASRTSSTMYMVLLASFNVVLSKYTGQEDIVVGSPVAGRRHADLQQMIGMFVNTLSMRNAPVGTKTFVQFLDEVRANTLNAYENQDYQFEELVANLGLQRDLSRNPLFDVMFSSHSFGQNVFEADGLVFTNYAMENNISKFDLSLDAVLEEDQIKFSVEYAVDLYSQQRMEAFIEHFINTLEQIAECPDTKLSDIDTLSQAEKTNILVHFNDTKLCYESSKTLQQLFEERVELQPNHPAVHFEGITLTYAELNSKVNQLARYLRASGVQREQLIPIMCERSIDMIVGILSVLKAGGAYLPIDPYYPADRIKFMLEDSHAAILITHSRYSGNHIFAGQTLLLDDTSLFNEDDTNLSSINESKDLAYVIYTSGSTGKPKGVMIEQRSVVNLSTWLSGMLNLAGKRFLHLSNVSFDNSVEEIFPQLISGATVYMLSKEDALDRTIFTNFIKRHSIDIVNLLPMTMKELLAGQDKIECLKHVMVGGDKLEHSLKEQILALGYTLTDHYGPTESTVDAIFTHCAVDKTVIGKPIANTRVYIVDAYDNPVAVGVMGEICIAGDGLARGYLNRLDLTAEKFVANPFEVGQRMYRTGDLAYWTTEGEIVYVGRVDNQIKIRGFRIELGEIEKQLLSYEQINDVIVIDRKNKQGNTYLCAYFVGEDVINTTDLRAHLLKELPDYMVPTAYVQLDRLPQTPNGKADRKALPEPEVTFAAQTEYVSARNETETKLVKIWSEILSVDESQIGMNDSFFDLGGNSITVMQAANVINDLFETQVVRVTDLFNFTTIGEIAAHINSELGIVEEEEEAEIVKFTL
ncbi:amino acid adenylation domain-containing protein [Paenibacillus sp. SC116]|uniref:non-ribosomal peptide synthetase n=1 Tax=Paenibacillus sp. SC116 TaxID=2968986 RepID=UPI00215AAE86|nr:non-ribosomal peptide synthetase [Paenibacillus sp. SC116]MCR8842475.1 amino acid adenylation domain-containing protein [Paenibacillus sp. SC116]